MEMHSLIVLHFIWLLAFVHLAGWFRESKEGELIFGHLTKPIRWDFWLSSDCKHPCVYTQCLALIEKCILPVSDTIPKRPGWYRKHQVDPHWLPHDVCPGMTVETASFWAMVDREHRRNEVAQWKQEVSQRPDMCKERRAANETDDGNRIDTPRMHLDQLVGPTSIECLVPEGDPGPSPCLTIATHATGVITAGDAMAQGTSATTASEKTETASTPDAEGDVARDHVTDTKPISTVVLVCFILFLIIYPRFAEQSFLVDLTCGFALFTFFYFYRVEGVLRQ